MSLSIERPSDQTLRLHQTANYGTACVWMLVALICALLILLSHASQFIYFVGFGLFGLASLVAFLSEREWSCTLDKSTSFIVHKRGGVLGSSSDSAETQYLLADIQAVVIKQHVPYGQRTRDVFQISLLIKPGAHLAVSAANLPFSAAQRSAQQIQQFIGTEVPIQGVDG